MGKRVFVGGLDYRLEAPEVKAAFDGFGEIVDFNLPAGERGDPNRGFAFVEYREEQSAKDAVQAMDGAALKNHKLRVSLARDRERNGDRNRERAGRARPGMRKWQ